MADTVSSKVRTCLWFRGNGEEAAVFYTSLLPDSRIVGRFAPDPDRPPLVIDFLLAGAPFQILNVPGDSGFDHSPAASISVLTDDQAETDRLWSALLGEESRCGWLVDRYGVSWQIVPRDVLAMLDDADRSAAGRAHAALMTMRKIDIAAIEAAFQDR